MGKRGDSCDVSRVARLIHFLRKQYRARVFNFVIISNYDRVLALVQLPSLRHNQLLMQVGSIALLWSIAGRIPLGIQAHDRLGDWQTRHMAEPQTDVRQTDNLLQGVHSYRQKRRSCAALCEYDPGVA